MPRYRLNVGTIPKGGSVEAYWFKRGAPPAKLGTYGTPQFEVSVPNVGPVTFQAYPKDATGQRGKPVTVEANTWTDEPERTAAKSLTVPDPEVVLEDAVLKVTPKAPEEAIASEVDFEIRASEPDEDETQAVFVGEVPAGQTANVNGWPVDNMKIHARPIYRDTGQAGEWATTTVETRATPPDHVQVEDNAGTSATGFNFVTTYGYTTGEFSSGFRNMAIPPQWNTSNTSSYWGFTGGPTVWAMADYFPQVVITSDDIDPNTLHEFLPVIHPEFGSTTEASRPIWDTTDPRPMTGTFQENDPDGAFREGHLDRRRRDRDLCIWNSAQDTHVGPIEIKHEIDLDKDNAGLPTEWAEVEPGHRYRAYALKHRFTIYSRFGTRRWTLSKLRLLRWIRNKKWEYKVPLSGNITGSAFTYTFSPAPEIIGTPVATVTVVDESLAANTNYVTVISSLSATAIAVTIHDVLVTTPLFGNPGTTDTYLYIVLTGY